VRRRFLGPKSSRPICLSLMLVKLLNVDGVKKSSVSDEKVAEEKLEEKDWCKECSSCVRTNDKGVMCDVCKRCFLGFPKPGSFLPRDAMHPRY